MNKNTNQHRKILIVDDDARNIFALECALQLEGFSICSVTDGLQAVKAVKKDPAIYLILMDIMMPLMDGFEATREIKNLRNRTTKIIGLSAHAMNGARERCLEAGFSNYLSKPVDVDVLLTLLHDSILSD